MEEPPSPGALQSICKAQLLRLVFTGAIYEGTPES
jgi:hypothetical protein